MIYVTLLILLNIHSFARITDGQVDIKIKKQQIDVVAKKNFHLNAEAPADIKFGNIHMEQKPNIKTEKLFSFEREIYANAALLSFYVCDDKKTVCEQHKETINFKNNKINRIQEVSTYNNLKEFNLKSINGKPTLLVFSAPWCPACIRMQTETYNKAEIQKQLQDVNFVKLNSDLADNYELSQQFKVKAIPTMILLDKNGHESYRWLDFQNAKEFATSLKQQLTTIDQATALLVKAKLGDADAASMLAYRAYNTLDYSDAFKWFSLTKSKKDQKYKLASEVLLTQDRADSDEKLNEDYLQALQKAIVLTSSKLDQIRWKIDFFEKKKDLKLLTDDVKHGAKVLIDEIDVVLNDDQNIARLFTESTYGNYANFEKEELLWLKGRLYAILDMYDEKTIVNQISAALIKRKKLLVTKPGEILLAISYLKETGDIKNVEKLYNQLINNYPESYVYYEKYARFLQKNKSFEKALKLVNESLKYPEGNEPQLNLLKSQILRDLNKKPEAIVLIDETLKKELLEHKKFSGTKKRLIELKEEISK